MTNRYYTGIGSRSTPPDVCELMTYIARSFAGAGLTLRSGHAEGADQAFERGAGDRAEIYLPWDGFNGLWEDNVLFNKELFISAMRPTNSAYIVAAAFHPAWESCSRGARSMHARNVCQIIGPDVDDPVLSSGVVCWTPDGSLDGQGPKCGGTGQALRVAAAYGVHVTNLARPEHREMAERWLTNHSIERSNT